MASHNEYDVGDLIEVTATFTRTSDGTPADPADVICTVRAPDGDISTPTVTPDGSGVYTAEIQVTQHGTWWYAFDGGPDAIAARENYFVARRQQVPRITPIS